MIIFEDIATGKIIGKINGKIHSPAQLKIQIGDPKTTRKRVIEAEVIKQIPEEQEVTKFIDCGVDENGEDIYKKVTKKVKRMRSVWGYKHPQKIILNKLDKGQARLKDYVFKNDKLVKKPKPKKDFGLR